MTVGLWKPNGVAGVRIEYRLDADETFVVLRGSGEVRYQLVGSDRGNQL